LLVHEIFHAFQAESAPEALPPPGGLLESISVPGQGFRFLNAEARPVMMQAAAI
jgi:hypothetical protein